MRRTIVSVPNLMHDLYEYLFMNQFALQILQNYICIRWKIRVAAKLVSYSVSYIKLIFLKKNSSVSITIILHFKRKRALILLFILLSEKRENPSITVDLLRYMTVIDHTVHTFFASFYMLVSDVIILIIYDSKCCAILSMSYSVEKQITINLLAK